MRRGPLALLTLLLVSFLLWPVSSAVALEAGEEPTLTCKTAKALADAGQGTKAEETYVKLLEANPHLKCASGGLKQLDGKSTWEKIEAGAKDAASWLGAVLAAAALAVAVAIGLGLLLLRPLALWSWTRNRWPAKRFACPSLEVKELDAGWMEKHLGPQFASLVRSEVSLKRNGGAQLVTGHAGISEALKPIGEISEASAAVAIIGFLEALLPRRSFEVGGTLHPAGNWGRGISIELTKDQRIVKSGTLWGEQFEVSDDDAKAVQELAVPAAAWADFQLVTELGAKEYLFSSDPESWALFEAGSAWYQRFDQPKAAKLYEKALEVDRQNGGALANLGLIRGNEREYPEAVDLMEKGLKRIEDGKFETYLNPDWYRVKFNLAAMLASWGDTQGRAGAAKIAAARSGARDLAIRALRVKLEPWRRRRMSAGTTETLFKALDKIVPAALAIYAATSHDVVKEPDAARGELRPATVLARLERNELSGEDAMRYVLATQGTVPETIYNVACAQSRRSEFGAAVKTLRSALETASAGLRKRLAGEALDDPSLRELRASRYFEQIDDDLHKWAEQPKKYRRGKREK